MEFIVLVMIVTVSLGIRVFVPGCLSPVWRVLLAVQWQRVANSVFCIPSLTWRPQCAGVPLAKAIVWQHQLPKVDVGVAGDFGSQSASAPMQTATGKRGAAL